MRRTRGIQDGGGDVEYSRIDHESGGRRRVDHIRAGRSVGDRDDRQPGRVEMAADLRADGGSELGQPARCVGAVEKLLRAQPEIACHSVGQ